MRWPLLFIVGIANVDVRGRCGRQRGYEMKMQVVNLRIPFHEGCDCNTINELSVNA